MYAIEERYSKQSWLHNFAITYGKRPDWDRIETRYNTREKAERQAKIFSNRPKNSGMLYRVVEINA